MYVIFSRKRPFQYNIVFYLYQDLFYKTIYPNKQAKIIINIISITLNNKLLLLLVFSFIISSTIASSVISSFVVSTLYLVTRFVNSF